MNDTETITAVAAVGAVAVIIAMILFRFNRRTAIPGFRLLPASLREWIAFWFHTLEFLVCCSVLLARHSVYYQLPPRITDAVLYIVLSLPLILLISAIASWQLDRSLARAGFIWAIAAAIAFLLIPPVPIT